MRPPKVGGHHYQATGKVYVDVPSEEWLYQGCPEQAARARHLASRSSEQQERQLEDGPSALDQGCPVSKADVSPRPDIRRRAINGLSRAVAGIRGIDLDGRRGRPEQRFRHGLTNPGLARAPSAPRKNAGYPPDGRAFKSRQKHLVDFDHFFDRAWSWPTISEVSPCQPLGVSGARR